MKDNAEPEDEHHRTRSFNLRKEYHRQYNAKRWLDPAFRERHRIAARESARRKRMEFLKKQHQNFPYGYRAPVWLTGDGLLTHFMDFIDRRFGNAVLTHICFEQRFNPKADDAKEKWAQVVAIATERCEGFSPLGTSNPPPA